jgi:hypothetical protein
MAPGRLTGTPSSVRPALYFEIKILSYIFVIEYGDEELLTTNASGTGRIL